MAYELPWAHWQSHDTGTDLEELINIMQSELSGMYFSMIPPSSEHVRLPEETWCMEELCETNIDTMVANLKKLSLRIHVNKYMSVIQSIAERYLPGDRRAQVSFRRQARAILYLAQTHNVMSVDLA